MRNHLFFWWYIFWAGVFLQPAYLRGARSRHLSTRPGSCVSPLVGRLRRSCVNTKSGANKRSLKRSCANFIVRQRRAPSLEAGKRSCANFLFFIIILSHYIYIIPYYSSTFQVFLENLTKKIVPERVPLFLYISI